MRSNHSDHEGPTRRDYMKFGGAIVGGGLLAGCSGQSDSVSNDAPESTETETPTPEEEAYSATMPPVGHLELQEPPSSWVGGLGFTADVLTALGHGNGAAGMVDPEFWYQGFYELLDGVDYPPSDDLARVTTEGLDTDLEILYDLDPDLMAVDPNLFLTTYGLEEQEVEDVQRDIAPWFGNESRRGRDDSWTTWPGDDPYPYIPIQEYVRSYGSLFGEEERSDALLELYDSFISDIRSRVPQQSNRQSIGLINGRHNPNNEAGWFIYNPNSEIEDAWGKKQYRDLNVVDGFDGVYGGQSGAFVDYEGLLEYDPDVIIFHMGVSFLEFRGTNYIQQQRELLNDHPIGSQLTAVQNDNLYVGGSPYQGPIINMFQTEMAAKQLYPDEFGPYPGLGELSKDEQLFDRQRLSDVINGDI